MLNIKALEKQFDEILDSLTIQNVENWLAFAEQREIQSKLKKK
jgi:hypothetical protein